MPSNPTDQITTVPAHEHELLFLSLVKALRAAGFVVNATIIADFIALFIAFPNLVQLKFVLSPIVSRNEEEQQSFYNIYDEWLKSQAIYDIIPPPPKLPGRNELHKTYILWVASIVIFLLASATIFAVIEGRHDRTLVLPGKSAMDSAAKADSLLFPNKPIPATTTHANQAKNLAGLSDCPIHATVRPVYDPEFENFINMDQGVKWQPVFIAAAFITLDIFLVAYFLAITKRNKLLQQKEVVLNTENFNAPSNIPFACKESLIYEEHGLVNACRRLKNKVENEIYELDIQNTIGKTIDNFGLFTPAYQQKRQDREFLILIDSNGTGDQQTHLFTYLANVFIRENIKVTWCYFLRDSGKFQFPNSSLLETWDHISQVFSESILVVISNGYRFIDNALPAIAKNLEIEFRQWEHRVLVTPVPTMDWDSKEKILGRTFQLLPADLGGWFQLVAMISGEKPAAAIQRECGTYSCQHIDFENIGQLKAYLNDEALFQWVCATAVYHQIRWELIVETGRKVLGDNNAFFKLNYSNLLKIFRISWMSEGVFPTHLRLELLKSLTVGNEILARKVMLDMLAWSDTLVKGNNPAYKEKALEIYTNKFILYAASPDEFRNFEEDEAVFLSFWQKGRLEDETLRVYLKNEKQEWDTPVTAPATNTSTIKIDNYILERNKLNGPYLNLERCLQILICFAINFALLHIITYNLARNLILSGMNNRIALVEMSKPRQDVKVSFEADSLFEKILNKSGAANFTVTYHGADTTETIDYSPNEIQKQPYSTWNGNVVKEGRFSYDFNFRNINFYQGYYKTGRIEIDILGQKFVKPIPLNCNQYLVLFDQAACGGK